MGTPEPKKHDGALKAAALKEKRAHALHQARLAAVQALYQMDIVETSLQDVLAEFDAKRSDRHPLSKDARRHFEKVLRGAIDALALLDESLKRHLSKTWKWDRMDRTLRAILRAGAYEILYLKNVPRATIIHEYVGLTHAFFDEPEPSAVNAILDSLSQSKNP